MKEIRQLKAIGACSEATDWLKTQPGWQTAWDKCEQGDWMLWLLGKLSGDPNSPERKHFVLVTCQCARLALPYVTKGERRPLKTIEIAEAWARGEPGITLQDVRAAAAAAYAAAYAAANAAANAAAYAAAEAAANAAKRTEGLKQCADIVRQAYPDAPQVTK